MQTSKSPKMLMIGAASLVCLWSVTAGADEFAVVDGFFPMFNGKDFAGWQFDQNYALPDTPAHVWFCHREVTLGASAGQRTTNACCNHPAGMGVVVPYWTVAGQPALDVLDGKGRSYAPGSGVSLVEAGQAVEMGDSSVFSVETRTSVSANSISSSSSCRSARRSSKRSGWLTCAS